MMNKKTQLFTIEQSTLEAIEAGKLNYIVERMKEPLEPGQRIIMQALGTDAEVEAVLNHVHAAPGMMKDYYILSFPAVVQTASGNDSKVVFDDPANEVLTK